MQGNSADLMKQEQMREMNEQISVLKREMKNYPHLEIIEKIGQGSFGDIYKVWDNKRSKWVAMKFEKKDKKNKYSLIKKEAHIMQAVSGSRYFAALLDSRFSEQCQYKFLEMTFLGPNLESLKKRMEGKFSLRTVLLIANQMISGIETLHKKGIIHRDIKPENFVIGSEGMHHQIFVIDFGLSKYYLEETGKHIEQKQNKGLVGTARYTSVNSHLGLEQSRRDDLESIAYLLLYFVKGNLIWQNLQFKDKEERFKRIAELKQTTRPEQMCKGLPQPFFDFISAVKSLSFEQEPEYEKYRQLFSACYSAHFSTPEDKSCYDWCPRNCPLSQKVLSRGLSSKTLSETHSLGAQNTKNNTKTIQELKIEKLNGLGANNGNLHMSNSLPKVIMANNSCIPGEQNGGQQQNKMENQQSTQQVMNGVQEQEQIILDQFILPQIDRDNNQYQDNNPANAEHNSNTKNMIIGSAQTTLEIENIKMQANKSNKDKNDNLVEIIQYNQLKKDPSKLIDEQINEEDQQEKHIQLKSPEERTEDADWHVSEFKSSNERKKIPIFKTENNYQKHQIVQQQQQQQYSTLGMAMATSHHQYFNWHTQTPIEKTTNFEIKAELENSLQVASKQINYQLANSSNMIGLISTPNFLNVQPFSIGNIPNKDSSQYVNGCSNEWSSLQDEKVAVQTIQPFNSQNNQQHF